VRQYSVAMLLLRRTSTLGLVAVLSLAFGAGSAHAAGGDVAATRAWVQADYRLVQYAAGKIPVGEAALQGVLRGVRRECPLAAAGSPQDAESTQLSNEVIGAMVIAVVQKGLPGARQFVRSAGALRWSNSGLTRQLHGYVEHVRTLTSLAAPTLCADVRAWAASGFRTLPASTETFDSRFWPAWVAIGELPAALTRYEQGETRSLVRRAEGYEGQIFEVEAHAVETWGEIMNALELHP